MGDAITNTKTILKSIDLAVCFTAVRLATVKISNMKNRPQFGTSSSRLAAGNCLLDCLIAGAFVFAFNCGSNWSIWILVRGPPMPRQEKKSWDVGGEAAVAPTQFGKDVER